MGQAIVAEGTTLAPWGNLGRRASRHDDDLDHYDHDDDHDDYDDDHYAWQSGAKGQQA